MFAPGAVLLLLSLLGEVGGGLTSAVLTYSASSRQSFNDITAQMIGGACSSLYISIRSHVFPSLHVLPWPQLPQAGVHPVTQ